jgi:hypothetical protein
MTLANVLAAWGVVPDRVRLIQECNRAQLDWAHAQLDKTVPYRRA